MRKLLIAAPMLALGACATVPEVVNGDRRAFEVRFDPMLSSAQEADEVAQQYCGEPAELLETRARFDTMKYRRYRCPGA